jgi:hypothetical protein
MLTAILFVLLFNSIITLILLVRLHHVRMQTTVIGSRVWEINKNTVGRV